MLRRLATIGFSRWFNLCVRLAKPFTVHTRHTVGDVMVISTVSPLTSKVVVMIDSCCYSFFLRIGAPKLEKLERGALPQHQMTSRSVTDCINESATVECPIYGSRTV